VLDLSALVGNAADAVALEHVVDGGLRPGQERPGVEVDAARLPVLAHPLRAVAFGIGSPAAGSHARRRRGPSRRRRRVGVRALLFDEGEGRSITSASHLFRVVR
jgi:hypothetical protein